MKRLARLIGIVFIFGLAGPVIATAVFALLVFLVGVPVLKLMLAVADLQFLETWFSIAMFLLFFFALASAVLPSFAAGILFGVGAIYFGWNSLIAVLVVAAIVAVGVVTLGFFVTPNEGDPLLLPSVRGARQGAALAFYLWIPAAIAASLSWLLSRPLHRTA